MDERLKRSEPDRTVAGTVSAANPGVDDALDRIGPTIIDPAQGDMTSAGSSEVTGEFDLRTPRTNPLDGRAGTRASPAPA
jgi:hypothetical protein